MLLHADGLGADPHEWTNQIDNRKYEQTIETMIATVPALSEMAASLPPVRRKPREKWSAIPKPYGVRTSFAS